MRFRLAGHFRYSFCGVALVLAVSAVIPQGDSYAERLPDDSIYLLNSNWRNQFGDRVELKQFIGRPVILTMFYTSCAYSCPVTIAVAKKMKSDLDKRGVDDVRFVLVSFDAERDSPQMLRAAAEKYELTGSNWTLLSGSSEDTRELAVLLGLKYKKVAGGEISHSNEFIYLDRTGVIRARQAGLSEEYRAFLEAVK